MGSHNLAPGYPGFKGFGYASPEAMATDFDRWVSSHRDLPMAKLLEPFGFRVHHAGGGGIVLLRDEPHEAFGTLITVVTTAEGPYIDPDDDDEELLVGFYTEDGWNDGNEIAMATTSWGELQDDPEGTLEQAYEEAEVE